MIRRLLLSFLLLPALVLGTTVSAQAQGIRNTAEYRELKAYASKMAAQSETPTPAATISKYRGELSKRRTRANVKVRDIYQQSLSKAKQQRTNRRDKVRKLRANRTTEVMALKTARNNRLDAIEQDRRAALTRINNEYDTKLTNLEKNRTKLQKKLAKATKASTKAQLREEISTVQAQINSQTRAKQDDITAANTKYNNLSATTKERAAAQIARTKAEAARNIEEAEVSLREAFAARKSAAQSRKANDFSIVKAEYERGAASIAKIPVKTP